MEKFAGSRMAVWALQGVFHHNLQGHERLSMLLVGLSLLWDVYAETFSGSLLGRVYRDIL